MNTFEEHVLAKTAFERMRNGGIDLLPKHIKVLDKVVVIGEGRVNKYQFTSFIYDEARCAFDAVIRMILPSGKLSEDGRIISPDLLSKVKE